MRGDTDTGTLERMSRLEVHELGTILSVWAHPDDEGYCCGGIMSMAVENGQRVVCVSATRGEQGSTDPARWPNGPELAAVRAAELSASLAVLGVTEHRWLDYPDGGCASVDPGEAVGRIRAILAEVEPDTVLTFGPDGGTFHPDHMAVSRWVSAAVSGTDSRVLHMTHTPQWQEGVNSVVPPDLVMMAEREPVTSALEECALAVYLEGEVLDRKYRAMLCQESQIGPIVGLTGQEGFRQMLAEEVFTEPCNTDPS
jgi:LmbE family N-acetylglucosaminyl deacetylase